MALRNERGATLVLMAIVIFMTLGMAALAIDYGMIKSAKAEAQRGMDAAALAGASSFVEPDPTTNYDSLARSRATVYAVKHTVRGAVIDTTSETTRDSVFVSIPNQTVKVNWGRPAIGLWFGRMFGSNTMGLTATATAKVELTSTATCLKPVAIPDIWDNRPHIVKGKEVEDLNGDHIWGYTDGTGRNQVTGAWDEGEAEPWTYDPSLGDAYSATSGYGTTFRDNWGTGAWHKTKDYGRQIMLTTLSSSDNAVSSMYYSWGTNDSLTSAQAVAAAIRGDRCQEGALGTDYRAANGGGIGQIGPAWAELIAKDPAAYWDDPTNTVKQSSSGTDWLANSPRVIVVALYNPAIYNGGPSQNTLQFINFAKVWVDQRPCSSSPGTCKAPITARFLGYLTGSGATGAPVGTLVKHIVLIK